MHSTQSFISFQQPILVMHILNYTFEFCVPVISILDLLFLKSLKQDKTASFICLRLRQKLVQLLYSVKDYDRY